MKKLLLVVFLFASIQFSYGQQPYYDAINMRSLIDVRTGRFKSDSASLKQVGSILYNYLILPSLSPGETDYSSVKLLLSSKPGGDYNPFLLKVLPTPGAGESKSLVSVSSMFSAAGGLDVTNLANGMSDFMIERAKEELTITFFDRFKTFLDKNPEIKILFPKTSDNICHLLGYKYPTLISLLRTGFYDDLKNLSFNLDRVLELPKYSELLLKFPEIKIVIRSLRLIQELESGNLSPAQIIEEFTAFPEWKDDLFNKSVELKNSTINNHTSFRNWRSAVRLAGVLSQSVRSRVSNEGWISLPEFNKLVSDQTAFTIFMGLIYARVKEENIVFYSPENNSPTPFTTVLENQKDNLFVFQNELVKFLTLGDKVQHAYNEISDKRAHQVKLTNDDYYNYINLSVDIIDFGLETGKIFDNELKADDYLSIARKSTDLFKYCYKEEFSQAIVAAADIFVQLKNIIGEEESKSLKKASVFNLTDELNKYGLFMANMVNAKSAEEVKSVIESTALPVGSSSIKKHSWFNISVQTYAGGYYNFWAKKNTITTWSDNLGFHGPIGISFSYGLGKAGSLSLFGSLLDLGAIIDYRLRTDSLPAASANSKTAVIEKEYKITLGQIVSPGVFAVYGVGGNIPIAIGMGWQYGPGLSKITSDATPQINNPAWRFMAFISVDIPLFTLFNKQQYEPYK